MPNEDDSSSWEDSSAAEEAPKLVAKKDPAQSTQPPANKDESSDEEWDQSGDEDQNAKPVSAPAKPVEAKEKKAADEWDDDSSDEPEAPVAKAASQKKSKQRKRLFAAADEKKKATQANAKQGKSMTNKKKSDSSRPTYDDRNKSDNDILFGNQDPIKRKAKAKVELRDQTLKDLYKFDQFSKKENDKTLKRLAKDLGKLILDRSVEAEDQNRNRIKPILIPSQVKDFINYVINQCCKPLDSQLLYTVRSQAEAEIKNLQHREKRARQKRQQGKKVVKKIRRVFVEEKKVVRHTAGSYQADEFDDIF